MWQKLIQVGLLAGATQKMFKDKDEEKHLEDAENEQKKAQRVRRVDAMEKEKDEFIKNFRKKNKL